MKKDLADIEKDDDEEVEMNLTDEDLKSDDGDTADDEKERNKILDDENFEEEVSAADMFKDEM